MRVFASKSFLFQHGEEEASIRNQEIKDMPAWIQKTKLFKLAKADGSISVIENSAQQKNAENKNNQSSNEEIEDDKSEIEKTPTNEDSK